MLLLLLMLMMMATTTTATTVIDDGDYDADSIDELPCHHCTVSNVYGRVQPYGGM
jgi:hypothetical protein